MYVVVVGRYKQIFLILLYFHDKQNFHDFNKHNIIITYNISIIIKYIHTFYHAPTARPVRTPMIIV